MQLWANKSNQVSCLGSKQRNKRPSGPPISLEADGKIKPIHTTQTIITPKLSDCYKFKSKEFVWNPWWRNTIGHSLMFRFFSFPNVQNTQYNRWDLFCHPLSNLNFFQLSNKYLQIFVKILNNINYLFHFSMKYNTDC